MITYEHAIAITSQLPFCSVPLRLDAYNRCQFSCAFCFSKARGGNVESSGLQFASADALGRRLKHIAAGDVRSGLDEFLARRIPIQFGGMNDPFGPWERKHRIGLKLLTALAEHHYPVLISSKSVLLGEGEYLAALRAGNFYVRQSLTALPSRQLELVERGTPTITQRLDTAEKLSANGVAVSVRLQPIFWGFEAAAADLLPRIASSGAVHVSAEYLKWPMESRSNEFDKLSSVFPDMLAKYKALGATRTGREFVLPGPVKFRQLASLKRQAEKLGLLFGFAETELLHLNQFSACCNASDLFLKKAQFFDATILGLLRRQLKQKYLRFPKAFQAWLPTKSVFRHINSRSRPNDFDGTAKEQHIEFLRRKWNSSAWRGGPASFVGVAETGKVDAHNNKIYSFDLSEFKVGR